MNVVKAVLLNLIILSTNSLVNASQTVINDDLIIIEITENILIHQSFLVSGNTRVPCNGAVFISNNEAIVFDTPTNDSASYNLIQWLEVQNIKVVAVVPTHSHIDCLGGLQAFHNKNITSYANDSTCRIAKSKGKVVPKQSFTDSLNIVIGNEQVQLLYYGEGHSPDNIIAWIPSEKALFGGCMIKSTAARGLGNTSNANLELWQNTVNTIINIYSNANYVIPGHGNIGGFELLTHTEQLLKEHLKND